MNDIHPIKPVIDLPLFTENQILIFWVVLAIILTGLILFSARFIHTKYLNNAAKLKQEPIIEPLDYQSEALSRLFAAKKLIKKDQFKKFYLEVSDIVKFYLAGVYQIQAQEMTSHELIRSLESKQSSDETLKQLKEFLKSVDMPKFADKNLEFDHAEDVCNLAKGIISR